MFRALALAAPLVLASMATPLPAFAQDAQANQPAAVSNSRCDDRERRRQRGRGIGSVLGSAAGMFGGRVGGVAGMVTNMLPVGELLGEAIASMLDRCEQQKAAEATQEVVTQAERGGVGTTVAWESETRPGVRGASTVTAVADNTPQGDCMTVTDIVIVDGEETRAPKQMCRRPPSTRYVRV
jgi:surface antigen